MIDLSRLNLPVLQFYYANWNQDLFFQPPEQTSQLVVDICVVNNTTNKILTTKPPKSHYFTTPYGEWNQVLIDLQDFIGQRVVLKFWAHETESQFSDMAVDDISIFDGSDPIQECPVILLPLDAPNGIVPIAFQFEWTTINGAASYEVALEFFENGLLYFEILFFLSSNYWLFRKNISGCF